MEVYQHQEEMEGIHDAPIPHDSEAERTVLGMLLHDNNLLDELTQPLSAEDFYSSRNKLIYTHIHRLKIEQGVAADAITVASSLKNTDQFGEAGGTDYIKELVWLGRTATNFPEYIQLVKDKAALRYLREETGKIQSDLHRPGEKSCAQIIDAAEQRMFEVSDAYRNRRRDSTQRINALAEAVNTRTTELYQHIKAGGSPITGIPTGIESLDRLTSGLQPADLVIIAARPSIGKTSLALDILRNACRTEQADGRRPAGGALFSLEMSAEQIALRLVGIEGQVDQFKLRSGQLTDTSEWERFTQGLGAMGEWPLWVDDTAMLSVHELRARARRIQREAEKAGANLDIIVVDYLQLMYSDSQREENRATEVSQITRGLKILARELRVPIIALSQLSRKVEDRRIQRPQLSDLRESGAIEQDADLIMFLSKAGQDMTGLSGTDEPVELIVGKHRNGPVGSVNLLFDKRYTHFRQGADEHGYDDHYGGHDDQGEPSNYDGFSS